MSITLNQIELSLEKVSCNATDSNPLRGALFENWAIVELIKGQCNAGLKPSGYFLRDKLGRELDVLVDIGTGNLLGIEIKSGATVASDFFNGLDYWRERLGSVTLDPWLIYVETVGNAGSAGM